MAKRSHSLDDILSAAEAIVSEEGAAQLTLDAVAERAGISKGGLLYNFPTKEKLLRAMLARLLDRCDADCAAECEGRDTDPAAALKAYIEVGFRATKDRKRVSAALLAAGANDPRLLAPVREWHRGHLKQFATTKRQRLRVLLVMLALDGLWLGELLQTSPVPPAERAALQRELLALADSAV